MSKKSENIIEQKRKLIENVVAQRKLEVETLEKGVAEQSAIAEAAATEMNEALAAANATAYATAMNKQKAANDAVEFYKARLKLLEEKPLAECTDKHRDLVEYVEGIRNEKAAKALKLIDEIAQIHAEYIEVRNAAEKVLFDWKHLVQKGGRGYTPLRIDLTDPLDIKVSKSFSTYLDARF